MSHREPFYLLDELSAAHHSLHFITPHDEDDSSALIDGAAEVRLNRSVACVFPQARGSR